MRELKTYEIAAVKRQFQNSLPALKKIQSLDAQIAKLEEEKAVQVALLEGGEAGIKAMTGGYKSTDLIKCTYELQWNEDGSPKVDKDGRQLKKRVLEYVVPTEAPETIVPPTTEGMAGSDFDADAEKVETPEAPEVSGDAMPSAPSETPFAGME